MSSKFWVTKNWNARQPKKHPGTKPEPKPEPTVKDITIPAVLEAAKETDIKVWFAYNTDFNRMNVAFHEPRVVESEEGVEL